jgi:hypothetical protein
MILLIQNQISQRQILEMQKTLLDFLLEYLYTLPNRIEQYRKRDAKKTKH